MALTNAQYAAILRRQRNMEGRIGLPARDPNVPVRIANPDPADFQLAGMGFDLPTIGTPSWLRPAPPVARTPTSGRGTGEGQPTNRARMPAPRRRTTPRSNPAAAAVSRSTTTASAPRTYTGPSGSSASSAAAAPRPSAPKPGTLRANAAASQAEFGSFDADTRNAALSDFKATHQWARQGDEDEVKKAVAYLLSREKGTFGSQRYADGAPANVTPDRRPPMRDGATEGFAGQPSANPAADAVAASQPRLTPSGKPAMDAMSPEALKAYRRRYNLGRADWSDDGSMERLEVQQRRDDSRQRTLDRKAEKAWRKRNPGKRPPTYVDFR